MTSTAGRRTRASSRRRVAARSSRRRGSSRELHELNGRWPGVTVNVGRHRRRDATERGGRACTLEVDVRATAPRGARDRRGRDPRDRRGDRGPRHDRRLRADGPLVADGEARAQRPAGRARPGASRERSASRSHDAATGGASDANTTSGLGVPSLDGLGPIGGNDHSPGGVPRASTRSCRGRRCWPACCWRSPRDPEVLAWRETTAPA